MIALIEEAAVIAPQLSCHRAEVLTLDGSRSLVSHAVKSSTRATLLDEGHSDELTTLLKTMARFQ